jgi:hypothetical protein
MDDAARGLGRQPDLYGANFFVAGVTPAARGDRTMKKLQLDLDTIRVDGFAVLPAGSAEGTVLAQEGALVTANVTCSDNDTCYLASCRTAYPCRPCQ